MYEYLVAAPFRADDGYEHWGDDDHFGLLTPVHTTVQTCGVRALAQLVQLLLSCSWPAPGLD